MTRNVKLEEYVKGINQKAIQLSGPAALSLLTVGSNKRSLPGLGAIETNSTLL